MNKKQHLMERMELIVGVMAMVPCLLCYFLFVFWSGEFLEGFTSYVIDLFLYPLFMLIIAFLSRRIFSVKNNEESAAKIAAMILIQIFASVVFCFCCGTWYYWIGMDADMANAFWKMSVTGLLLYVGFAVSLDKFILGGDRNGFFYQSFAPFRKIPKIDTCIVYVFDALILFGAFYANTYKKKEWVVGVFIIGLVCGCIALYLISVSNCEKIKKNKRGAMIMKRQDYISWDEYFMGVAMLAARRSKDPNTQVGACIVSQDNIIISTGYNGMPKGCSDDIFPWDRTGEDTKYPYVVHAELNAILNASGRDLRGSKLYVALFPCNECAKAIIQSGVREVLYLSDKYADSMATLASKRMMDAAGVKYTRLVPRVKEITLDLVPEEWK